VGSPTGVFVIGLSASRLARMSAAIPEGKYLFHIISEYKPYLLRQRHIDMDVRQERAGAGSHVMVVIVIIMVHNYFLSPISSITLSILK
jgi:hypothetical protein